VADSAIMSTLIRKTRQGMRLMSAAPVGPAWARQTFVVVAALVLAACTGRPSVKSNWVDTASRSHTYSRLLVVGVSPDYTQRCNFEFWLVRDLRSENVPAEASCSYMTKEDPLNRDAIVRLVEAQHYDAVVATSLVSAAWKSKEGGTYDTRSTGSYKYVASGWDTGFYGLYGMPVDFYEFKTLPSITNARGQVHVLTKVFDTRDARLIYSIDIKARDIESSQLGLAMITPAIAEQLQRDRLVR
jgi:hypothetical protein